MSDQGSESVHEQGQGQRHEQLQQQLQQQRQQDVSSSPLLGAEDSKPEVVDKDTSDEHLRRKREREGSLEPSASPSAPGNVTPDAVPTKKNRRQNDLGPVPGSPTADSEAPSNGAEGSTTTGKGVEGEKVQHIRKRVEDLTWKERREQELGTEVTGSTEEEASAAQGAQDGDVSEGQAQEAGPSSQQSKTLAEETSRPPVTPARKQPTFSSFSSAESPFAAATSAGASDSSTVASTSSASTPARTQPTFSSFSSAASPLAAAAKAGGSASPFLSGSSSAAAPGGGIKPSPLGAAVGSPSAGSTPTPPRSVTPLTGASTPKAGPGGNALGFGAFAGASPFAKAGASPNAESSANQSETKANGAAVSDGLDSGASEPSAEKLASASSFGDILSGGAQDGKQADGNYATSADKKSGETEAGAKAKIALEEQNLTTGEEDERTVHSARAKLYTMAEDQSWKERGTGTVRCNVPKNTADAARKGARLVMRADGVLRVILNVPLFAGMSCELAQDKFVRIVALEEGKLVHFAIKLSNPQGATAFYRALQAHIPSDSKSSASSDRSLALRGDELA